MSEHISDDCTDHDGPRMTRIDPRPRQTARDTFHHAAELIATHLVPEEHATATAATFWTIGDIADDAPLSLADLAVGLELLVSPRVFAESPATVARRNTYDAVAALIRRVSAGDPQRLASVFRIVAARGAESVDPHHAALATIAAREAAELETV